MHVELVRAVRATGIKQAPVIRPLPTVLIGAAGTLLVGVTSVGSGSIIMVLSLTGLTMLGVPPTGVGIIGAPTGEKARDSSRDD